MNKKSGEESLELRESVREGIAIIAIVGEMERANVGYVLDRLDDHLRRNTRHLLLDLDRCPYLDSAALSAMLSYLTRMRKGSRLAVAAPNSDLLRLFAIAGLEGASGFDAYEDVDEAIGAIASRR